MYQKNDELTLTVSDISIEGHGIAKQDGAVFFCQGLLPGETARVKIIKTNKRFLIARPIVILSESESRIAPACPVFKRCGGCSLQHLAYPAQLNFKTRRVKDALLRIGGIDVEVQDCAASPKDFNYRNKAMFPVAKVGENLQAGFYAKHSHDVVDIAACPIQHPLINQAFSLVKVWLKENKISIYDEKTHKGLVRQIFARVTAPDALMVGLVATRESIPHIESLIDALMQIETLKSVMINVNSSTGNTLLGDKSLCLYGEDTLLHTIDGLNFKVSLNAFLQVNTDQTESLYRTAMDMADIQKTDTVIDLFCGIGTLTLLAAKKAKKVYGIEYVQTATDNARENAAANQIGNAEFICGDCTALFAETAKKAGTVDVLIVDPPRKGLDVALISQILKAAPKRMVYVSCDPGTLARDLKLLSEKYAIEEVKPFDMFPQTTHVETVVLLEL